MCTEGANHMGLSMCHNSTHKLTVYQNYSEIKDLAPQGCVSPPPKREEGDIKGFSKKSRLRMMKRILSMKYSPDKRPIFITLTYHKQTGKKPKEYKLDIARFTRWLNNYDPNCRWVWKMEFQKRGAIHYHLIYFPTFHHNYAAILKLREKVSMYWHAYSREVTKDHREYGTNVKHADSDRQVIGYTVKYVTKEDEGVPVESFGRYWAVSGNFEPHQIVEFEMPAATYFQIRRIIRRWVKARKGKKTAFYRRARNMASISAFMPHGEFLRLVSFVAGTDPTRMQILLEEFA